MVCFLLRTCSTSLDFTTFLKFERAYSTEITMLTINRYLLQILNIVGIEILYPIEELGRLDCMGHIYGFITFHRQNKTEIVYLCQITFIEY